jgi:hypothetical protein
MKHLKEKYKKLKHAIYDYEEVPDEEEFVPEEINDIEVESPSPPPTTRRRVSRADYLNYRRFGF